MIEEKQQQEEQKPVRYLCVPEADLPPLENGFLEVFSDRMSRILSEFVEGFQFVRKLKKSVTVFGSTRAEPGAPHYEQARELAFELAKEGHSVVTGGGPGIMEAANKGAYEAKGESLGINIQLPGGQRTNEYVTKSIGLHYFFVRRVMFSFASRVYIFFPGGYGTLDEFFEIVTLVQTKKMVRKVLILAVGKEYWNHLFEWIKKDPYTKYKALTAEDLKIPHIVDSPQEALKKIKDFELQNPYPVRN